MTSTSTAAILHPMFALATWTFLILGMIAFRRFAAASRGEVTPGDFRFGESASVPPHVVLPNRNYMNLLELPMLFYVACLALAVFERVDGIALALAWSYVAARIVHSLIHLSYNNVMHRLGAFATSNFILLALWLRLLLTLPTA